MAGAAPLPMRRHLFQDLSLPSQPRDRSRPLGEILADEGIGAGSRVGVVGWKGYARPGSDRRAGLPRRRAAPASPGRPGAVEQRDRTSSSIRPTACASSTRSSSSPPSSTPPARRRRASATCCSASRPGMTEREAVRLLDWDGSPLSCHLMLTSGPAGHARPAQPRRPARSNGATGSPPRSASGARSTAAPASWSRTPSELPAGIEDYVERLVGPYFEAVGRVVRGAARSARPAATLQAIVDRHLGDPFFGIFLNPGPPDPPRRMGQLADLAGLEVELRSGMAFQVDIIPATGTDYFTTNIEDGDRPRRRGAARPSSRPATRRPGRGSRRAARSCAKRSGSTSTRTCCRSPTSPPTCRRSCFGPSGR